MRVTLLQRYIERENGRLVVYQPGDVIDIPHGQILIDRGKATAAESVTAPKPAVQLTEPPPGRRGRPKGN